VNFPEVYAKFSGHEYAPDLISAQAREFIEENKDRPFFLYYPTTVPHLALQVPEDSLAEYAGKFPEEPYDGSRGYLPHRAPRAAYAAMVTRMDREIGRILDLVKELGLDDNTILVFSSDNGPLYDKFGGTDAEFFESAGPLNGRKGSMFEGGIREPTIVRWKGHVAAGTVSNRVSGFEDWMPTLLELIGEKDATPAGIDGISMAPTLLGKPQIERPFLYRESPGYGGQASIRVGPWKAIREKLHPGPKAKLKPRDLQLFDLANDIGEHFDVADQHPDIVVKLGKLMQEQHVKSELFPIRALDAP
jgi:arylsulfatase A-like enzyme